MSKEGSSPVSITTPTAEERLRALEDKVRDLEQQVGAEHDAQIAIAGNVTVAAIVLALVARAGQLAREGQQERSDKLADIAREIQEYAL